MPDPRAVVQYKAIQKQACANANCTDEKQVMRDSLAKVQVALGCYQTILCQREVIYARANAPKVGFTETQPTPHAVNRPYIRNLM